jgi:hypothetical protein
LCPDGTETRGIICEFDARICESESGSVKDLQITPVYMENTKHATNYHVSHRNNKNKNKNYNDRFKTLLFSFRLGGHPLMMKSVSRINRVHNVVTAVCFYSTIGCLAMDAFVHRHQLVQLMKKVRLFVGMIFITWTHFSFR